MTLKSSTPLIPVSLRCLFFAIFSSRYIPHVVSAETCGDGKLCLNNSKCVGDKLVGYTCDCSFTYGSVDLSFAGSRCEYRVTMYCNEAKGVFCANGGTCGSYIIDGRQHEGCNCRQDYTGAHCQYSKSFWREGISGKAAMSQIGPNFYTKDVPCGYTDHNTLSDASIGSMLVTAGLICFFLAFCVVLRLYIRTSNKLKDLQVRVTKELDERHVEQEENRNIVCIEADTSQIL